jgi:hypothetical protein
MPAYAVIRLFSIFPFYQTDDMYTLGEGKLGLQYFGNFFQLLHYMLLLSEKYSRGRILGRNPDKSLKSFHPCYSQSPPQLCLDISISPNPRILLCISSNSRNLLHFLQFSYCTLQRKPPSLWLKKSI